ncbi:capsid protein [Chifec genomovirus UA13_100]|nr:capsid protein [Chifec genomovirus UA13_100]
MARFRERRPKRKYFQAAKKRSSRRRSYAKKRSTFRSRKMSKKKILNLTSRKKRNGMLAWSNTDASGASATVAVNSATIAGSPGGFFCFCPTAMNLNQGATNPNYAINVAERTASTCFMRGFQENLRIQTNTHLPWFHRRVCFTWKGSGPFNTAASTDTPTQTYSPYVDTSNGMERIWMNQSVNNMSNTRSNQWEILFKGALGSDWNDLITAPIDTARVSLKFDKTWCIKSGNEAGTIVERKLWHGMNKNLVFDDDETGESMKSGYFSTDSKAGMGDYYVMDIFQGGMGAASTDLLNVVSNSTLYWHER